MTIDKTAGVRVQRQRVEVHVDLVAQRIRATTELNLVLCGDTADSSSTVLGMYCRGPNVLTVRVNGERAEFELAAPASIPDMAPEDPSLAVRESVGEYMRAMEAPEMRIRLPHGARGSALAVAVDYELDACAAGVRFFASASRQYLQAHTEPPSSVAMWCPSPFDAAVLNAALPGRTLARTWLPCVCEATPVDAWDLEYVLLTEGVDALRASQLRVVSSGALCQQFASAGGAQRFQFRLDTPASPGQVRWAAGTFDSVRVPNVPYALVFCPAGQAARATHIATDYLCRAFGHTAWLLSGGGAPSMAAAGAAPNGGGDDDDGAPETVSFPYPSFYVSFLRGAPSLGATGMSVGANVALLGADALCDTGTIEQNFATRALLSHAVAAQFFGQCLRPASPGDAWLVVGLQRFAARAMLRVFHGHNEHMCVLRREAALVCAFEDATRLPSLVQSLPVFRALPHLLRLAPPGAGPGASPSAAALEADPRQDVVCSWLVARAHLALQAVEHRLGRGALARSLALHWAEALSSGVLSAQGLARAARRVTGKDVPAMLEQWACRSGVPALRASFVFNRRRSVLEVTLRQSVVGASNGSGETFAGPVLLRVHEIEGVYDHVVHVSDTSHAFELPVHARARKIRRRCAETPSVPGGIAAAGGGPAGAPDAPAPEGDDTETVYVSPVAWVRLDPEMEWLAAVDVEQPEEMLVEQLQGDRDVLAQLDALDALARAPTDTGAAAASGALADGRACPRVRVAAAHALVRMLPSADAHSAPLKAVWFYNRQCALQASDTVVVPLPRPNSMHPFGPHVVLRGVIAAMGRISVSNTTLMELVGQILLNVLRFNDNAHSAGACDAVHLSRAAAATASHVAMRSERGLAVERVGRELVRELDRYAAREAVLPSFQNALMAGVLAAYGAVSSRGVALSECAERTLADALRPGNHFGVRAAALLFFLGDRRERALAAEPRAQPKHTRQLSREDQALEDEIFGGDTLEGDIAAASTAPQVQPAFAARADRLLAILEQMIVLEGPSVCDATAHILGTLVPANISPELALALSARSTELWRVFCSCACPSALPLLLGHALPVLTSAGPSWGALPASDASASDTPASDTLAVEAPTPKDPDSAPRISLRITLPVVPSALPSEGEGNSGLGESTTPHPQAEMGERPAPHHKADDTASRLLAVHASVWAHYDSLPFRYAVPAGVPGYYTTITHPMDLSMLAERIRSGACATALRFADDIRLMTDNCLFFNVPASLVCEQARRLRSHACKELRRLFPEDARALKAIVFGGDEPTTAPVPRTDTDLERISASNVSTGNQGDAAPSPAAKLRLTVRKPPHSPSRKRARLLDNDDGSHALSRSAGAKGENMGGEDVGADAPLQQRMRAVIDVLWGHAHAYWFQAPVDPVALKLPTYTEIVREPMDLGTLRSLVDSGAFSGDSGGAADNGAKDDAHEFARLLVLVFDNCMLFNPQDTLVHQHAREMRRDALRLLRRHVPEAADSADAPPLDSDLCARALAALDAACAHDFAAPFLAPVDAALYPSYRAVVRHPMDLGTMRARVLGAAACAELAAGTGAASQRGAPSRQKARHSTASTPRPYACDASSRDAPGLHAAMAADARLMVANCERFNGRDAPIAQAARALGEYVERVLAEHILGVSS